MPEQEANCIINAGYKFAKRRFDRELRWEPSAELEAAIFQAIFGKTVNLRFMHDLYNNLNSFGRFRLGMEDTIR